MITIENEELREAFERMAPKVWILDDGIPGKADMAFIFDNIDLRANDPGRLPGGFAYLRPLMIASLSLVALITQGCSMENVIKEHDRVCRRSMKIIVHDDGLWREYRAQSEAAYQKEIREIPPFAGRSYHDPVGEFEVKFGEAKADFRKDIPENNIVRDDLFIMKGNKIVIQLVDFIAYYKSIDGPTGFSCLHLYKDQITGSMDQ